MIKLIELLNEDEIEEYDVENEQDINEFIEPVFQENLTFMLAKCLQCPRDAQNPMWRDICIGKLTAGYRHCQYLGKNRFVFQLRRLPQVCETRGISVGYIIGN